MNIDLEKQVLPVYKDFFYDKSYYSILYGGRGSGKSRAISQKIVFRILSEQNHIFVIVRDKMTDHTNSTYREFKEVVEQFGMTSYVDFLRAPMTIRFPHCNSEILFLGLDDSQRLKGLSGVTGIWFEEISEIKEQSAFEEVMSGFRPDKGHYEQVMISFNPVSKDHWIKKRFFDDDSPDRGRAYILRTTWEDNRYLNRNTVQTLLNLRFTDEQKYKVNVLGEWGSVTDGKEFYKMFRYSRHVDTEGRCFYNPDLPLHVSFDFNLLPHMTMVIFQIVGRQIRVIDEIRGENPHNTVYGICNLFKAKYPSHDAGLFVYGDPSGKERSQVINSNDSNIQRIAIDLDEYHPVFDIPKGHPRVPIRAQWINLILSQQLDGISVLINPRCNGLIADFSELQEDENGGKLKEKVRTKRASFEKYGHFSDAFDYFITSCFKREWQRFSKRLNGLTNLQVVQRLPLKYGY